MVEDGSVAKAAFECRVVKGLWRSFNSCVTNSSSLSVFKRWQFFDPTTASFTLRFRVCGSQCQRLIQKFPFI